MKGEEKNENKKELSALDKAKVGAKKMLVGVGGKLIIFLSFILIIISLFLIISFVTLSNEYINEMNGTCIEANEFGLSSKVIRATAQQEDDFILKQSPKYEEVTEKIRLTDLKLTLNNDPIVINIIGKWLPWRANSGFSKPNENFICMLEKVKLPDDAKFSNKEEENEFYYIKNYYSDVTVNKLSDDEIKVIGIAEAPERQKNCWVTRGAGLYLGMFGTDGRSQPTSYHHLLASKMLCASSYWFGKNINNNDEYVITKYYVPAKATDKKVKKLRLNKIDGSLRTLFSQEEGGYLEGSDYFKLIGYKDILNNFIKDIESNYRFEFESRSQEDLKEKISSDGDISASISDFGNKIREIAENVKKISKDRKYNIDIDAGTYVSALYDEKIEPEKFNSDLEKILTIENDCQIPKRTDDVTGKEIRECKAEDKVSCCKIKYNIDENRLEYFLGDGVNKKFIRNNEVSVSIIILYKLRQVVGLIEKEIETMEGNAAIINRYDGVKESEKISFVEKDYTFEDFKRDYFTLESYGISSSAGTESSKILTIEGNQVIYDIDLHEKLLNNNINVKNPAAIIADSISMFGKACYLIDKDSNGNVIRKGRSYFQYGPKKLYKHFSESEDIEYKFGESIKMLIADKYYSDNDGFYNIEIISGINFDDAGTIASRLREIEFYLFGTPNQENEEEDRADGVIASIFNNLLNTGLAKFARAVMSLYVVIFGFRIIFGFKKNDRDKTPIKTSDLMIDLAKMVIVITMVSPSGFQFFNRIVLNFTINGVIGIVDILGGIFSSSFMSDDNFIALEGNLGNINGSLSLARNFKVIDEVLSLLKNDALMLKIFSLFYNSKSDFFVGIPVGIGVLVIVFMYFFKLFKVVIPFFFTMLQMTIVLPLAPLFMLFNFFDQTQYLFKNWLKFVLQKCLEIVAFFTAFYFMTFIINDFIKKLLSFKVCFGRLGDHICETVWNGECGGMHFIRKKVVSTLNNIIYMGKENMPNGNESFFLYYTANVLVCLVLLILFEDITKMISSILGSVLVIGDAKSGDLGGNTLLGDIGAKDGNGSSKFGFGDQLKQFSNTMGISAVQKNSDMLKWTRSFVDLSKNPTENLMSAGKKAYNLYKAGGMARIEAMQERIEDKAEDSLKGKRNLKEKWQDYRERSKKYRDSVRAKKREKRKEVFESDFKELNESFGKDSTFDIVGLFRGEHKRLWNTSDNRKGNNKNQEEDIENLEEDGENESGSKKKTKKTKKRRSFAKWAVDLHNKFVMSSTSDKKQRLSDRLLDKIENRVEKNRKKKALDKKGFYGELDDRRKKVVKMTFKNEDGKIEEMFRVERDKNGNKLKDGEYIYSLVDENKNEIKMDKNDDGDIVMTLSDGGEITVKEDGSCIISVGEVEYIISNEGGEYIISNENGDKIIDSGKVEEILSSIKIEVDDSEKMTAEKLMEAKMEKINKKIEKFKKMEEEQKKLDEKNNED